MELSKNLDRDIFEEFAAVSSNVAVAVSYRNVSDVWTNNTSCRIEREGP